MNRHTFHRVYLELTNACNCACDFCPHTQMIRPIMHMNPGLAKRMISEVHGFHMARELTFHVLGEPSLYPEFFDILTFASRLDIETVLTTNGMLLNDTFGQRLRNSRLDRLVLSIQTPDEQSFAYRRAPLAFAPYKQGILDFLSDTYAVWEQSHYVFRFLYTHHVETDRACDPLYSPACSDIRALKAVMTQWIHDIFRAIDVPAPPLPHALDPLDRTLLKKSRRIPIHDRIVFEIHHMHEWIDLSVHPEITEVADGQCLHRRDDIAILSNGDVVMCCLDFNGRTALGNVRDCMLTDVLNRPKAARAFSEFARGRVALPFCRRCLGNWHKTLERLSYRL